MFVYQRFELNKRTIEQLRQLEDPFKDNPFGEIVFYRTYSRTKENKKQETWLDVVIRVINGTFSIRKDWYIKNHIDWDEDYWQNYASGMSIAMFKMYWLPPGRGLWAMGTDFIYEEGSMALNNCGFIELSDDLAEDLCWMIDALMLGVGVGFEPIRNDDFKVYLPKGYFDYVIPDSREGWVNSIRLLINAFIKPNQKEPRFDYSLIRSAGNPIKRFGGISSGPEPLVLYHDQIRYFFYRYYNWKNGIDDYYDNIMLKTDLANTAGHMVVSGNVRRSAELCKGKITDKTFLNLKQYQNPLFAYREPWGGMSNNAAALEKLSDFDHLGEIAKRVIYNAEPGIMNLQNFPLARIGKRDFKKFKLKKDPGKGGNPCTSKKSLIFTRLKNGETKILLFGLLKEGDLIWSETGWTKVLRIWSTGIKPVYRYHTTAGYVDLTEDHKIISYGSKIQVKEASCIDILVGPYEKFNQEDMNSQAILSGLLIADGTVKDKKIYLIIGKNDKDIITDPTIEELINKKSYEKGSYNIYETYQEHLTINDLPYTYYRKIPNEYFSGNKSLVISFLRGLYSGNGSICGNRVTLKATSKKLINQVQIMLSSIGIRSYITTNKPTEVEFDNGNYTCKQSYDLNISNDKWKFYESIGFIQNYKMIKLKELIETKCTTKGKSTYDIIEKEYLGEEEVYDCTVDNLTHTFWLNGLNVSNCVEQILENYELCTLADTLPTKCPNNNIWLESCEYASVYVQTVTLLPTHQSRTNKVMSKNRRVGVGLMDFVGWKHKFSTHEITRLLRLGYKIIWKTLKQLAEESGVPEAIRFSTVKPNGSTAKVAKVRSGAGYSNFKYMIRRIRIQQNTSFYNILCKANIPHEPDLFSANTEVFEYPFSLNDDTKSAEEVTLWEQAMNLVLLQREWSNNSVSNTLMFKPKWLLRRIVDGKDECKQYIDLLKDIHIELPLNDCPSEIVDEQTKLKLWYNDKNIVIKIEEYNYNPRHEEDDIEPVLSAIVPLIKTCSLSPHTPKGVYKQMPEEGITKEEYERRVAEIKPIDWNSFVNNDVNIETDKYCTGDKCEII